MVWINRSREKLPSREPRRSAAHPRPGATWPRTRCFEPVPASQARLAGSMRTIAVALVVLALWAPAFAVDVTVDCTIGALYVWSARLIRCPMADATMRIPLLKAGKVELAKHEPCIPDMKVDPLQYFEAVLGRALDYAKDTELSTGCEVADLVVHGAVPLNVTSEAEIKISDFETELQDWLTDQTRGLHKATNHSWAPVVAWGNSPVKRSGQTELLLPLGEGGRRPSSFVRPEAAPFLMQDIAKSNFARQFLDLASSVRVPEAKAKLPSFSLREAASTAFEGLEHIRQAASGLADIQAGLVQVYNYPVSLRENIVPSMALLRPESLAWTSLNSSLDGLEGAAPKLGKHAQSTS
ncbi:hypothetical protein FNF27_08091 [Cafeteria roenbergensis]|uniref:Uncharacterized protein n=1 Tax=Cafeteria roenbergensis TaxID=33653 RepID=A0A5A8D9B9_CAFRO|nr:hypothetical protein FNF27_08091 [Cafeteria roenbergensis]